MRNGYDVVLGPVMVVDEPDNFGEGSAKCGGVLGVAAW
jgi:hypothetical protein